MWNNWRRTTSPIRGEAITFQMQQFNADMQPISSSEICDSITTTGYGFMSYPHQDQIAQSLNQGFV